MQSSVRWTAAFVGIAIVALFVVSFVPVSSLVGGAGALTPAAVTANSAIGGRTATVAKPTVTPHGIGPHPGTLEIWEASGGGPSETDPSVCYYTVCFEPILNVFQTLIAYNGTADGPTAASYVPQLATCVPGSLECAAQFGGNDLVVDNNTTGAPQYYTFEIDSGAHFYDPTTHVGWGVYPSDVLFSFARTMGFADLPYEEATNGWINTQDLVPGPCSVPAIHSCANSTWDSRIHFPLNNTPQNILDAFLVNNSYFCPTSAIVTTNGCITFNLGGSGLAWPYFLELVTDGLGGSIQPCGLYTHLGAGVPGFAGTNASNGDGPCLLPGNTTSTQQVGYQNYVTLTPSTGWDNFELLANNIPSIQPSVQWTDVGSGPYWVENPISPSVGYNLHTNPDYNAPVGCVGQPGCEPIKGTYAANVQVVWEASGDTQGLNEMTAGQADTAGFYTSDVGSVLGDSAHYGLISGIPALTVFFDPITLNFSLTKYAQQDSTPTNIPATFFGSGALRNFLVDAFPYTSVDQTYNTVDGIQFGEDYGGAIPHGMGDYYPANVTWPGGNPVNDSSVPGNVGWWWAQLNNPSSPEYDAAVATGCTAVSPCHWDMFGVIGNTPLDGIYALWNAEIFNLSAGHLNPGVNDITGTQSIINLGSPAGQNPMPVYSFGWIADYPDPSDFTAPMYYPDNSYTAPDAVSETLQSAAFNSSSCPSNYGAWSNLTYYANIGQLPDVCQGAAYDTMTAWENIAAHESNPTTRVLQYNLIEHIAALLGLYVYNPQQITAYDYGLWIEPTTINVNPTIGGGATQPWYQWGYASDYSDVSFTGAGLPSGTVWSVTLAGVTLNATAPDNIDFGPTVNGTYTYTVGSVAGYLSTPASGQIVVNGAAVNTPVLFKAITGVTYTLTFAESNLKAGTSWGLVVTGSAGGSSPRGTTSTLSAVLPTGTYNYTVDPVTGYNTPASGSVSLTKNLTVNITFVGKSYTGYSVTFTESGLPTGASWSVTVNGTGLPATTAASITTSLGNGSYSWGVVSLPTGSVASPSAGYFAVAGAAHVVDITITQTQTTTSSSPAWTYLSTLAWVLIGVLALLVIIFLALAMMAGRRPPSSPPESWSSSSSSTTESKDNKGGST